MADEAAHRCSLEKLKEELQDVHRNVNAGMPRAAHVITVVNVVNVNLVGIAPTRRQGTANHKPIAAVAETRMPGDDHGTHDYEPVLVAEMRAEMVFRDMSAVVSHVLRVTLMVPLSLTFAFFVPLVGFMALMIAPASVVTAAVSCIAIVAVMAITIVTIMALVTYGAAAVMAEVSVFILVFIFILVLPALVAGIVVTIVLRERRHGGSHCESQQRSQGESNKLHQIHLHCGIIANRALCCRSGGSSAARPDMYNGEIAPGDAREWIGNGAGYLFFAASMKRRELSP
jgi:hypothetical protein